MGIGTDVATQLLTDTADRGEISAAIAVLQRGLNAHDTGEQVAREKFAASKPAEFAPILAAEIAKKLAEAAVDPFAVEPKAFTKP